MDLDKNICNAVIMDCIASLRDPTNGFDNPDYVDKCHCKANLQYVISQIGENSHKGKIYQDIILRNNQFVSKCKHIWHDDNIKLS